jgi:hypothetical protein
LGSWDVDAIAASVKDALRVCHSRRAKELMQMVKEQVVAEELERRRRPQLEQAAKRKKQVHGMHFIIRFQEEQVQTLRRIVTQLEERLAARAAGTPPPASKVGSRVVQIAGCITAHVFAPVMRHLPKSALDGPFPVRAAWASGTSTILDMPWLIILCMQATA